MDVEELFPSIANYYHTWDYELLALAFKKSGHTRSSHDGGHQERCVAVNEWTGSTNDILNIPLPGQQLFFMCFTTSNSKTQKMTGINQAWP